MAYVNVRISRGLKEELGWAIDKRFHLIINKLVFKNIYTTKNLKNKAIFNLKKYCTCCYVTYPLLQSLASYKVYLCFIVLSVKVCTVRCSCLIYEVLYT